MMKCSLRGATAALSLCGVLAALASTAAAGNPHGTPPGQAKASVEADAAVSAGASVSAHVMTQGHVKAHGHFAAATTVHTTPASPVGAGASASAHATAPGQMKRTSVPVTSNTTVSTQTTVTSHTSGSAGASVSAHATAPGQVKKALRAGTTATSPTTSTRGATGRGSTQLSRFSSCVASPSQGAGVQPFSSTLFWTCAAASSSQTKLYGNGGTAGGIAMSRGGAGAELVGPGNSQPHKVLGCVAGRLHFVDVHAVKSYASTSACSATSVAGSATASTTPTGTSVTAGTSPVVVAAGATTPSTGTGASAGANNNTSAGVKGAAHAAKGAAAAQAPPTSGNSAPTQGVLGATATQQLPFTGLQLWIVVLAAAAILAGGFGLRRLGSSHA